MGLKVAAMVAGAELDLGKEGREPSAGERGGLLYEEAQVEGAGAGTSGACRGGSSAAGSV
jgi:hypothetical protein